jgi:hypothetical protein
MEYKTLYNYIIPLVKDCVFRKGKMGINTKEAAMPESESEKLKRLRQKQLTDRDPLVKQRQFQHNSVVKEKRMQKPFSFTKAWGDIPHSIKIPFCGLIAGVLVIIFLPNFWESPYAIFAGVGITLLLIIFGFITGNSLDLRDDIKKHIK